TVGRGSFGFPASNGCWTSSPRARHLPRNTAPASLPATTPESNPMKWLWRSIASLALGLGALGVVLPCRLTITLLLLAAWTGERGWPHIDQRLLRQPKYGTVIIDWRERGAVPRKAKWMASALVLSSLVSIWLLTAPMLMRWFL